MLTQLCELYEGGTNDHCNKLFHLISTDRADKPFWMYNSWLERKGHKNLVR